MSAISGTFAAGPEWVANAPTSRPALPASFAKVTDGSSSFTHHFKMVGQDAVTTAKDTWVVLDVPDFSGAQYAGPLTPPLRNIAISEEWDT
jgi:hypothetical protein